jgi:TIR domain
MTIDAAGPHNGGSSPKARVFISYSREDMAFADRLEGALKARAIQPLIDRSEIYAFEDWWKRIEALIAVEENIQRRPLTTARRKNIYTPTTISVRVISEYVLYFGP